MRRLLAFLALLIVFVSLPVPVAGEGDPVNVSTAKIWFDIRVAGPCTAELYIQSVSPQPIEVSVTSWWNYIEPESDARWIDPSWLTRISPMAQTLLVGEKMLVNIELTVPVDAPDVKYQAWVKVAVGDWEKPITLNIRKGSAIPDYKYGISPDHIALLAYGPGATQIVEAADPEAIVVISQCSAATSFMVGPEDGCGPFIVSEEQVNGKDEHGNYTSAMFGGKPEFLGSKWKGLGRAEIAQWFTSTAVEERPLRVAPFGTARIGWKVTVPDSTADGNYWFWVRLEPAEPNPAFLGTEYLIKFFVTVERGTKPSQSPVWLWFLIPLGCCLVIALGWFVVSRLRNRSHASLQSPGPVYQMRRDGSRHSPRNVLR